MASGSPEHHLDRLEHRMGDRSVDLVLAAQERMRPRECLSAMEKA
jgi:hypothetical protein